ncbi:hypothetical protein BGM26_14015 [Bacillus sp. FJAT-29790]|nr:hypothetical protein [Bacillus sp. FJAT-29790]MBU8880094.1 hypothetical protein [Bacillus sp. FJAT-29790]
MAKNTLKTISISYVHDPEAAKKWGELYFDLLLDQMKKDKKSNDEAYNDL